MDGLTPRQHDRLAAELEARRRRAGARVAQLDRDLRALFEATEAAPDDEHDPEGATIGFERAQTTTLLAEARSHLDALDRARADLDADRLGTCATCGSPIGFERLLARPTSRHCIACAAGRS